jgi:LytS/YehU family sensor histidine kinase
VGGIGLKNVQTRLNILYPNRHELKIADESNEYIVELKLKQQQ